MVKKDSERKNRKSVKGFEWVRDVCEKVFISVIKILSFIINAELGSSDGGRGDFDVGVELEGNKTFQ